VRDLRRRHAPSRERRTSAPAPREAAACAESGHAVQDDPHNDPDPGGGVVNSGSWWWFALVFCLAACDVRQASMSDPYVAAKMDLKPTPARVSSDAGGGPFAAGSALSTTATLKPLDPAPVKEVRLDTVHKLIDIAPGV